jgi:hypothetical protein
VWQLCIWASGDNNPLKYINIPNENRECSKITAERDTCSLTGRGNECELPSAQQRFAKPSAFFSWTELFEVWPFSF